jgi:hypothetical protein
LIIRFHLWVHAALVLHDLVHDQFRVSPDLEAFDPKLNGDSEAVDQGFVLGGIV